jgi:hypothetical protein
VATSRWISDVAAEVGLTSLDVVRLLAIQGMYPYSGYLEDQHVTLLKARRSESRSRDVQISQTKKVPPLPYREDEKSSITAPISTPVNDGSEEKTMILPPLPPPGV